MVTAVAPEQAQHPELAAGFAGSQACAECHADIAKEHAEANHARTLRPAAAFAKEVTLPEPQWVADPEVPTRYRVTERDGGLGVEAQTRDTVHWQPTEWAFGSGMHAMTSVGKTKDGRWVEAPLSFYRHAGWDFTVGFLGIPPADRAKHPAGTPLTGKEVSDCFDCHTTGLRKSASGPDLKGAQLGVQCERCHEGGAEHIRLAKLGRASEGIQVPGKSSAREMVKFCATCHRLEPPPGLKADDPVVARFAPVGFIKSRCFLESKDTFSCTSCHSPHGNASRDRAQYRQVCGGCHGGKPQLSVCPVQPQGDCVSCHMPQKIVQRNSIFTDHWIRVFGRTPAPAHPTGSADGAAAKSRPDKPRR